MYMHKEKNHIGFEFIQERDIELIVLVIKENLLASVSTCNNVVKGPKEMYPWFSGHDF